MPVAADDNGLIPISSQCRDRLSLGIGNDLTADDNINGALASPGADTIYTARLRDISYTSFDVQKDDSYTGRGRVGRRRGDDGAGRDLRATVQQLFTSFYYLTVYNLGNPVPER